MTEHIAGRTAPNDPASGQDHDLVHFGQSGELAGAYGPVCNPATSADKPMLIGTKKKR